MVCPKYQTAGLENTFTRIQHQRMADVPILNPALEVQAVGFRIWEERCLGVLITPWFMNLMLLPGEGDDWHELPSGTKINHVFPSGNYEFILGKEDGIGHYLMCSLYSPVFEFQSQEAAVVTAEAVMAGLMNEDNRDDISTREREIQKIWCGEDEITGADAVEDGEDDNRPTLKDRIEKPMSRRDLLRGAIFCGEE